KACVLPENPASYRVVRTKSYLFNKATAIQEAYSMLEERASRYAANPMISPMIEAMKEDLRQQILDSAEQQRQENGQDGN
nr:hypothetical protein [Klebsiella pneumoniae]